MLVSVLDLLSLSYACQKQIKYKCGLQPVDL